MGETKNPIQKRALETRHKIINASYELFTLKGYKKTNTILIAKKAGLSIGIVYTYFKDKDELFDLYLEHLLSRADDYFYNQLKLLSFSVELNIIVNNILEKLSQGFFSSPVLNENSKIIKDKMKQFFWDGSNLFIKACNDNNVFVRNTIETCHIIITLINAYTRDLQLNTNKMNKDVLRQKYVTLICSLLIVKK